MTGILHPQTLNSHCYLNMTCKDLTSQLAAQMGRGVTRLHPTGRDTGSHSGREAESVFFRDEPLGRLCMLQWSTLYTCACRQPYLTGLTQDTLSSSSSWQKRAGIWEGDVGKGVQKELYGGKGLSNKILKKIFSLRSIPRTHMAKRENQLL